MKRWPIASVVVLSISGFVAPVAAQESNVSREREMRAGRARAEAGGGASIATEGATTSAPATAEGRRASSGRTIREESEKGVIPIEAPKRFDGIAEVGVGWLLLPNAVVCGGPDAGCSRGDTTPTVDIWNLVRLPVGLAFGAGLSLGLIPTADVPQDNPPGIERDHKRGYMTIEGLFRYYPFQGKTFEGWLGLGPGLVIVSDTFSSRQGLDENAYVGNPGVTLRTEGLTVLAALGASIELTEHWYLGATLRGGIWRVPSTPATSPLGDEASLTGTNTVAYAGINVAFRSKL